MLNVLKKAFSLKLNFKRKSRKVKSCCKKIKGKCRCLNKCKCKGKCKCSKTCKCRKKTKTNKLRKKKNKTMKGGK